MNEKRITHYLIGSIVAMLVSAVISGAFFLIVVWVKLPIIEQKLAEIEPLKEAINTLTNQIGENTKALKERETFIQSVTDHQGRTDATLEAIQRTNQALAETLHRVAGEQGKMSAAAEYIKNDIGHLREDLRELTRQRAERDQ